MRYWLRGTSENGDPVDVLLEICWRCGMPVSTFHVPMDEHNERMHPADDGYGWTPSDDGPRHAYREPPTVPAVEVPAPREPDPLFDPFL